MKNNNTITDITVTILGKTVRPSATRPDQLVGYFNLSVGAIITGKQDGETVHFEYISGRGFGWVKHEAK